MKNLIKYIKYNGLNGYILTFNAIIGFPMFVIHEISHIIFNIIFLQAFDIDKFIFLKFNENTDKFTFYTLELSVYIRNKVCGIISALAPSITYFLILYFSIYYLENTTIKYIFVFYLITQFRISNISTDDYETIKLIIKK